VSFQPTQALREGSITACTFVFSGFLLFIWDAKKKATATAAAKAVAAAQIIQTIGKRIVTVTYIYYH
jgi:uncharacterized membrane protein